jgi:hypothetical protein
MLLLARVFLQGVTWRWMSCSIRIGCYVDVLIGIRHYTRQYRKLLVVDLHLAGTDIWYTSVPSSRIADGHSYYSICANKIPRLLSNFVNRLYVGFISHRMPTMVCDMPSFDPKIKLGHL